MKVSLAAVFLGAAVTLSACETTTTTTRVVPAGAAQMNVVNQSGRTAFYVQMSPCSSSSWGADRLGSGTVLSSGETRGIALGAGCWDMRASDSASQPNGETWVQRNVQLAPGGSYDWTLFR